MYKATIRETSREFTAKERIMFKDTANANKLDEMIDAHGAVTVSVADYVILDVHNDEAKDRKDYTKIVIVDTEGEKYVTGSESFVRAFKDIYDELAGEQFIISCFKKDSKNYAGKQFMTCSLVG